MRIPAVLLVACAACANPGIRTADPPPPAGPAGLPRAPWDEDGAAEVLVYEGRVMRYGHWRPAEARDYLVREYLDPETLVKREPPGEDTIPVLKMNRLLRFTTGTYEYRMMASLFVHRETGAPVKAVASSQEACGLVHLRWDAASGVLSHDSYWEDEAVGSAPLALGERGVFEEQIALCGNRLRDGGKIEQAARLLVNRVVVAQGGAGARTVRRDGSTVELRDETGAVKGTWRFDADGFLESWEIPGREAFRRKARTRLYYWNETDPGDERLLR